jgi:hypothetical protein
MYDGHICVAGIGTATGMRVRPVVASGRLEGVLLAARGGPFAVGNIVDIGRTEPHGSKPEIEDVRLEPEKCRLVRAAASDEFFALLRAASSPDLSEIGPALMRRGGGFVLEKGQGECSLAIVPASSVASIGIYTYENRKRVRFRWQNDTFLSVTDVRLYEADLETPNEGALERIQVRLRSRGEKFLCFGLSRASWTRPGDDRPYHWLQLNNVHISPMVDWSAAPGGL